MTGLKRLLKALIERLLYFLKLYSYKVLNKVLKRKSRTFLILPGDIRWYPFAEGSFGDDIMFLSICQEIGRKYPNSHIGYICLYKGMRPFIQQDYYGYKIHQEIIDEPFTSLYQKVKFLNICKSYSDLIVLGADVLDGGYGIIDSITRLKLIKVASKVGLKTIVLGFSYLERGSESLQKLFTEISSNTPLCIRDVVSYQRLNMFVHKNIFQTADISFNVNPHDYKLTELTSRFIEKLLKIKQKGKILIAINLVGWSIQDLNFFIDKFTIQLTHLSTKNNRIVYILIPHDLRSDHRPSDKEVLELLATRMKTINRENYLFAEHIKSGLEAKAIVGKCDLLISGRMHLAIAALGQNVPALSFGYQGKFEGLYQMFGLGSDFLLDYNYISNLADRVEKIILEKNALSASLESNKKNIIELARKNFELI